MNAIRIIFQLLPFIIQFIHAAETAFPGHGTGQQKLNAVTDAVGAVVDAIPQAVEHAEAVKASLKPTVDNLVKIFNGLGVFKKGDQPNNPYLAPDAPQAGG